MKKKLSLLLAVVLAMTMIMGIGVTALADKSPNWPNPEPGEEDLLAGCVEHPEASHFYATGNLFGPYNYVEGIEFAHVDSSWYIYKYYDGEGSEQSGYFTADSFEGGAPSAGWYYASYSTEDLLYCRCEHQLPVDPDEPVSSSAPAHEHNFQWQIITEPTKDTDGLEGEMCSCGAMRNTEKISAYAYSLYQYAMPMINNAKSGQTITFEFGEWNSFPKAFMEKIAAKSMEGVTFVFHYKWNHEKQEITIPFGTAVDTQFDWYGPAKMAELYGMN